MRLYADIVSADLPFRGALIVPHLKAYITFGTSLVFFEATTRIVLASNHFIRHAAVCQLIINMGVASQFDIFPAVEYFVMVDILVFFLFNNL